MVVFQVHLQVKVCQNVFNWVYGTPLVELLVRQTLFQDPPPYLKKVKYEIKSRYRDVISFVDEYHHECMDKIKIRQTLLIIFVVPGLDRTILIAQAPLTLSIFAFWYLTFSQPNFQVQIGTVIIMLNKKVFLKLG